MKNNNHASKALAVVLSGALAFAPAANAALDESNMAYTSAAEGFYGSLRVQYANNDASGKDNDSKVEAESSRLGVRGDVDLGGGLSAFYGFEWNLGDPADGHSANNNPHDNVLRTRQQHVGLKGDWGSIWAGAFDSVIVRFGGFSTTDILDQYSGNFEPIYRNANAVAYVSPDLNGFNFGVEVSAQDGTKDLIVLGTVRADDLRAPSVADDGNDFDNIGVGASYSIQGLTFSGAYYQNQDALGKGRYVVDDGNLYYQDADDKGQYALGVSFSQDNWIVAAMYGGEDVGVLGCVDADSSDTNVCDYKTGQTEDGTFFSLAAGVSIDKLDIHGLWEQKTEEGYEQFDGNDGTAAAPTPTDGGLVSNDLDTTITAISARYHLGSKARLRAAWRNIEEEIGNTSTDNTHYALGLRVDF